MSGKNQKRLHRYMLALVACMGTASVGATELVYYPLNPSFGGSPLNGPNLLNSALATKTHKAPDLGSDGGRGELTALQSFQESLERSILSRLSQSVSSQLFDPATGNLIPGTLETQSFIITIADMGGGNMLMTTTDKVTGNSTTVELGNVGAM